MNMIIREAEERDILAISKLYVENWHITYEGIVPKAYLDGVTQESAYNKWTNYIDDDIKKVFVAYGGEALLGIAACKKDLEISNCLCLDVLHVDKRYRKQGAGTALIEANKEYMKSLGYDKLRISIICDNEYAKNFYAKLGAEHFKYYDVDFKGENVTCEKLLIDINKQKTL